MRWTTTHSWILAAGLLTGLSSCALLYNFSGYDSDAGGGGRGGGGGGGPGGPGSTSKGSVGSTSSQSSGSGSPGHGVELGGGNNDSVLAMTLDKMDNIVIAGTFQGSIDVGGVTLSTMVATDSGLFLAKFSPLGGKVWTKLIASAQNAAQLTASVAVDPTDNTVIIAGGFGDELYLDPLPKAATGGIDVFVAKIDAVDGSVLWRHTYSGVGPSMATAVATDPTTGVIAMAGNFTMDFTADSPGPCGTIDTGADAGVNTDAFIAEIDRLSGNCIWLRRTNCTMTAQAQGIAFDTKGSIDVTGVFTGMLKPGAPVMDLMPMAPQGDSFLLQYNDLGAPVFAKSVAPKGHMTITVEPTIGTVVLSGDATGKPYASPNEPFGGAVDMLVAKYDTQGTALFARLFGGPDVDTAQAAPLPDNTGRVVMGGAFKNMVNFGAMSLVSAGGRDAFVTTLDAMGVPSAPVQIGNAADQAILFVRVPALTPGIVVVAGNFTGTMPLGMNMLMTKGGQDIFVGTIPIP